MKALFVALTLSSIALAVPHAQTASKTLSLDAVLDFDATVKALAGTASAGGTLPTGKFVMLAGTVGAVSKAPGQGTVYTVELVYGEWIETTAIESFHVYLEFSGEEFSKAFDRRTGVVKAGAKVIVIGKPVEVRPAPDGSGPAAFLTGFKVRVVN